MPSQTVDARFWAKVARRSPGECWEWLGAKDRGYGRFRGPEGATVQAHRFAFDRYVRPLAPKPKGRTGAVGEVVCHQCDNPACVNPAHLFVGSQADNLADMQRKGRKVSPAILTQADADAIRRAYTGKRGEQVALARQYGIAPQTVNNILRGRRWS